MSQDSYTVTSSTGWFGRIGNSFKGIIVGLILILISIPLLFINEGRAVKTRKSLEQGEKSLVAVSAEDPSGSNDGKLVYFTGDAVTEDSLTDMDFGVSADALRLQRVTEYYQWEEDKKTETKKKLGGGEERVEKYDYVKRWVSKPVDSTRFEYREGHENPAPAVRMQTWNAEPITVGGFTLSSGLVGQIDNFTELRVEDGAEIPKEIGGKKVQRSNGGFYLGENPKSPVVGDVRVNFMVAMPGEVSVIAKQNGVQLEPFTAEAGGKIEMLATGRQSSESMFQSAHDSNTILTWALRIGGFILMFIGFVLLFKPLSVLADVVPLFGTVVGAGTGIIAFLLSIVISFFVISVAWIFYRPLIGIPLIVIAGVGLFLLIKKLSSAKKAQQGFA